MLSQWDAFLFSLALDDWLDMQDADECDDGPCGDDPDCPCSR